MEIVSEIARLLAQLILCVGLLTLLSGLWLRRFAHRPDGGVIREPKMRKLSDNEVLVDLTAFLHKQNVVGDADIRDGVALAPVPPERLDPLALVLGNAAAFLSRLRNPAACSLYVRDSVSDRFMLLPDLDLDHLLEASRVMQRVAEDRRKSRTLYKGLTDEEMLGLARAAISQWHKRRGEPETAYKAMQGDFDHHPTMRLAVDVLDLTFKVKGARND